MLESRKACELLQTHSKQTTQTTQSGDKDLELVVEARDRVVAENQNLLTEKKSMNEAHIQEVLPFFRSHLVSTITVMVLFVI